MQVSSEQNTNGGPIDRKTEGLRTFVVTHRNGIMSAFGLILGVVNAITVYWTASINKDMADAAKNLGNEQIDQSRAHHREIINAEAAQNSFDDIREILTNPESTIQSQIYALRQVPYAMRMEIVSGADGAIKRPNLAKLKALLRQFIRSKRLSDTLASGDTLQVANLTSEIVALYHRLGVSEDGKSIWKLDPSEGPPASAKSAAKVKVKKLQTNNGMVCDLSFLESTDLKGAQLPLLFGFDAKIKLILPKGTELMHCDFQRARFYGTDFTGANFSGCDLQGAIFEKCVFKGISTVGANLKDVQLIDCVGDFAAKNPTK